ncbi:protein DETOXIFICATION 27-like isoform X2 [Nicotiana sylvestris]|uniref:Protein TRANSPARENT TESTA 12-like isoform X2 n=1 Tax=Nicotiana sylvestris TaxID=4096 RepID=A0A1U7XFF4_NICSY|nr:PREDICTED: protein TRANSPARENT TESTA 12-like isoform X2 [Nicotiana sylvestris]
MGSVKDNEENRQPLLAEATSADWLLSKNTVERVDEDDDKDLKTRVWIETKKLWHIVGPSIFSRIASYTMNIITQGFAGHLGEVELAAISISNTVIVGLNFGLLLGMASALETLCGQAFGAKKHHMLGIYMQRSWIVLFLCCFLLLPLYIFATPILRALGQPDDVAELSGVVALWFIPLHFSFAFQFPIQRFLQSQLKTAVLAWVSLAVLAIHTVVSWLFVYKLNLGIVGAAVALDISWWLLFIGLFWYTACGGCPETWSSFSTQAFSGLWEFIRLSAASGVMLCLENWYYRILMLMTGYLENATLALDALSICDYAGDQDDRRSTSGYVFMLAVWLRRILEELKFKQEKTTTIFCDNNSAIKLSKNPVLRGRSKHIDVKYYFLRDLNNEGIIELTYCRSEDQLADIFTKPLKLLSFQNLRRMLGLSTMEELKKLKIN